jgi:uncharacterized protein YbjT (DUF2867 family)
MNQLVTLFGGGGFLGRYVAQALLKAGARVRIAERDPSDAWFLKPLGGLGQTQFVAADIRKPDSVARAIQGSDAVVNLVGVLAGDFKGLHVDGAANVAKAAAAAGVKALVHLSAIGADPEAASAYGRSKGQGEQAVRAAFPAAAIIRPSIVFGPEDHFVNRFAQMAQILPALPVLRPTVRFQPVWVADVARAVAAATLDPQTYRGVYELGGPQTISMQALVAWIAETIGRKPSLIAVPDGIGKLIAQFGFLPGAPITTDQWLMLQHDNVVRAGAHGFEAFGFAPSPLAAVAPGWLVRFRRHGRFANARA